MCDKKDAILKISQNVVSITDFYIEIREFFRSKGWGELYISDRRIVSNSIVIRFNIESRIHFQNIRSQMRMRNIKEDDDILILNFDQLRCNIKNFKRKHIINSI